MAVDAYTNRYLTTKELAQLLRLGERKVYDLASSGDIPCVRAVGKLLFPRDAIDAWLSQTHSGPRPISKPQFPDVMVGSHDPLLDWALLQSDCGLARFFGGSNEGLERFVKKNASVCALSIHEDDGWNSTTVATRFANQPIVMMEFCKRERGLIVSHGNAPSITAISDLKRRRIARRHENSTSQRHLEALLREAGIDTKLAFAAQKVCRDDEELAMAVKSGHAEAALGLRSMAEKYELSFVPLFQERFDLLVWDVMWFEPPFQKFLKFFQSEAFYEQAKTLVGYDVSQFITVHFNTSR